MLHSCARGHLQLCFIAKYCENYLKSLVGSQKLNFFFHVCMSLALGSHKPNIFFHVCMSLAQLCSSLFKNHDGDDTN